MKQILFTTALTAILSLNLSTAWAISQTWNCGEKIGNDYGGNVQCTLDDDGVFTISGSGKMADYNVTWSDKFGNETNDSPWGEYLDEVVELHVGDGVTGIGNMAFSYNANNLTTITGMKDVTSIGEDAFCGTTSLTSVNMPNVTELGQSAFEGASSLTSVDMPNVTSIGSSAFMSASSLTSVDMPNVTSIGTFAFADAKNLDYVGFNLTNTEIGEYAFVYYDKGDFKPLSIMSACGNIGGYQVCTTCNSNQIYQPGSGCASACGTGYTANDYGFCQKNSTQSTPTTPVDDDLIDDIDDLESCPEGKIAKGDECIPASQGCGENYKLDNGICYRIRYTPAEAAQVVGETNTIFLYYK